MLLVINVKIYFSKTGINKLRLFSYRDNYFSKSIKKVFKNIIAAFRTVYTIKLSKTIQK